MNIDFVTILNGCHATALIITILLILLFPTFTVAIFSAKILLKVTWLMKFAIRLCRTPNNRAPYRSLWRCFLVDALWESF